MKRYLIILFILITAVSLLAYSIVGKWVVIFVLDDFFPFEYLSTYIFDFVEDSHIVSILSKEDDHISTEEYFYNEELQILILYGHKHHV